VVEVSRSPLLVPDEDLTATIRAAHREQFGASRVVTSPPSMATEDVGCFATVSGDRAVPLAYWMLGSVGRRQWESLPGSAAERLAAAPPNHSPRFAPAPGPALGTGIQALVAAALTQLRAAP